jgi:hypothetical protein
MGSDNAQSKIFARSFISGGIAGLIAKTSIAPIERMKIIFQVSNEPLKYVELYKKSVILYEKHGLLAFWRGNLPGIMRIFPFAATQFAVFDTMKYIFITNQETDGQRKAKHFIFGATAGVVATTMMYPLDLLRTRMAMVNQELGQMSLRQMVRQTLLKEGKRSFFNGIGVSLLGVTMYKGFGFMLFEYFQPIINKFADADGSGLKNSYTSNFLSGGFAGLISQFIAYPFDVLKKKYQSRGNFASEGFVKGQVEKISYMDMVRKIGREEGLLRGMYKGYTINIMKGPIANGIAFSTKFYIESLIGEKD